MEDGEIAVLMNDLSPYLFPDVKEPIEPEIEKAILNTLASLHAAFWESSELKKISWLAQPARYLETFSPGIHPTDLFAQPPEKLAATITQGWELALGLLPKDIRSVFLQPSEKILKHWESLPATLLHGDVKIANMAHMPGGRIAAFDWAFAGHGPCSIDLGWYISVNSSRLAQSKEEVIATYRAFLEDYLPHPIDEKTWKEIVDLAVFTGARMLLWNKALGYNAGTEKGIKEWDWWLQNLEIVTKHMSDAK
jgi:thiamine kinase-like enzyme